MMGKAMTAQQLEEIEAVNREQAMSLDAAMQKMRVGVVVAPPTVRKMGRPTNAERLARAQAAGLTLTPAAPKPAEKVETIDIPVFRASAEPAQPVAVAPAVVQVVAKKPANDGGNSVRQTRFPIDDDVPLPEAPSPNGLSYPWQKLEVGQSFFIPEDGRKHRGKLTSMYSAHKRYPGRRFRAVWQDKDPKRGVSGFRVWRVQ